MAVRRFSGWHVAHEGSGFGVQAAGQRARCPGRVRNISNVEREQGSRLTRLAAPPPRAVRRGPQVGSRRRAVPRIGRKGASVRGPRHGTISGRARRCVPRAQRGQRGVEQWTSRSARTAPRRSLPQGASARRSASGRSSRAGRAAAAGCRRRSAEPVMGEQPHPLPHGADRTVRPALGHFGPGCPACASAACRSPPPQRLGPQRAAARAEVGNRPRDGARFRNRTASRAVPPAPQEALGRRGVSSRRRNPRSPPPRPPPVVAERSGRRLSSFRTSSTSAGS